MSSHRVRWTLLLLTLFLAGAGPCELALAGMDGSEFEEEPLEFFCITPDGGRGEVCVSLYLDEDGYQVCLSDEAAETERCVSYYSQPDYPGDDYDSLATSTVRLIDC